LRPVPTVPAEIFDMTESGRRLDRPSDPVDAYRPGVDRTLLEKNQKLSVEERFLQLMELQRFAVELRRAGDRMRER
jgi:hypothetical protein